MAKTDISKLAERLAQLNSQSNRGGGGGLRFHSIKDGRNVFRILPAHPSADMFFVEAWVHYGVGKNEQNKKGSVVVCPTTHGDNKPCPVCEVTKELRALSKKKDDNYHKQASAMGRKKRVYYNAIDREEDLSQYHKNEEGKWINAEGEESNPVGVLATGVTVFKDLLNIIVDPEYGDITDADEGLDVILTKTGSNFNTEYDTKTVRKNSPIGFDSWEECLNDITVLAKCKTYDEILAIMEGRESDDATEEEEKPAVTQSKGSNATPAPKEEDTSTGDDLQDEIRNALARRKK